MSNQIQEVFGQFVVQLETPVMYKTYEEAEAALIEFEQGAEMRELAARFCAYSGVKGDKAIKGKTNVIVAFQTWMEAGQPEPEAEEEEGSDEEL